MNRLTHDNASLLRACQMSSNNFFCFVEGTDNDIYFYSQLTDPIFRKHELSVHFHTANYLTPSGTTGGKELLIKFFQFLCLEGGLSSTFKGKKTSFVFLLDKDVDEFKNDQLLSKHIFYTEHYDLQNYLIMHGDVINSAAACASQTVHSISHTICDQNLWLTRCIITWKDWVTICLFLKINNIGMAGYGVSSKINSNGFGPLDPQLLRKYKESAQEKSGLTKLEFDELYTKVEIDVDKLFALGQANRIFKGKWYLDWLANHLKIEHNVSVRGKQLAEILVSNLKWNGRWTKPYKDKLNRLIKDYQKTVEYS